ncbi:hypothetical protein N9955_00900 [bacterium]|nr:hypothetical protein [bacterium]
MSDLSDEYLIKTIKKDGDEECLMELISRHSGIYVNMVKTHGDKYLNSTQINDLICEKDFHIYKAAIDYDESKSKFSTYLANIARYRCLTNKTINKKSSRIVNFDDISYDQEVLDKNPQQESEFKEALINVTNIIESHEDPRVKTIFEERYFSSSNKKLKPWKFIAPKVDLSIQGCINVHDKVIKELKKELKTND